MATALPKELLYLAMSNDAASDLSSLCNSERSTGDVVVMTHRNSLHACSVESAALNELYKDLPLKKGDDITSCEDQILVCVPNAAIVKQLRSGKYILEKRDVQTLMSKVYKLRDSSSPIIPAICVPLREINNRFYHLQFDIDRSKESDPDNVLLDDDAERTTFVNLWRDAIHSFCGKIRKKDIVFSRSPMREGGFHVVIRGIRVEAQSFRNVTSLVQTKIGAALSRLGLSLDAHTALFVPGCHKSGKASKRYRLLDGAEEPPLEFPVCVCHCEELIVRSDGSFSRRKDTRSTVGSLNTGSTTSSNRKEQRKVHAEIKLLEENEIDDVLLANKRQRTEEYIASLHAGEPPYERDTCSDFVDLQDCKTAQSPDFGESRKSRENLNRAVGSDLAFSDTSSVSRMSQKSKKRRRPTHSTDVALEKALQTSKKPGFKRKSSLCVSSAKGCFKRLKASESVTASEFVDEPTVASTSRSEVDIETAADLGGCTTFVKPQAHTNQRLQGSRTSAQGSVHSSRGCRAVCRRAASNSKSPEDTASDFAVDAASVEAKAAVACWGIDGFAAFSMERVIRRQVNDNMIMLVLYRFLLDLMLITSQSIALGNARATRYSVDHVCWALTTYARCVWRDMEESRHFTLGLDRFIINIVKEIIKDAESRTGVPLHQLQNQLVTRIPATLGAVECIITDCMPTITECLFSILHIGSWSVASNAEIGIPSVSGRCIANTPVCTMVVKALLEKPNLFDPMRDAQGSWTQRSGMSEYATALNANFYALHKAKLDPDSTSMFLAGIAYPCDGEQSWNCASLPHWERTKRTQFEQLYIDRFRSDMEATYALFPDPETEHGLENAKKRIFARKTPEISTIIAEMWRAKYRPNPLPPGVIMTEEGRLIILKGAVEVYNLPCFRFSQFYPTGFKTATIQMVYQKPLSYIRLFIDICRRSKALAKGAYLSYPNGRVSWDANSDIILDLSDEYTPLSDSDPLREGELSILALTEVLNISGSSYMILVVRDTITGKRKKLVICYSDEANRGKTTSSKSICKLFGASCHGVGFNVMTRKVSGSDISPAFVNCAGKMVVYIDEVPATNNLHDNSGKLCMSNVKMITGGTRQQSFRNVFQTSESLALCAMMLVFSNTPPAVTDTRPSDLGRIHFVEYTRQFTPNSDDLSAKIDHIKTALEIMSLAVEFAYQAALENCSESLETLREFYEVSMISKEEFSLDFFRNELSQKCSPSYEKCINMYRPDEEIVVDFTNRNAYLMTSNMTIKALKQQFRAFVKSHYKQSADRLPRLQELLEDTYRSYRENEDLQ